MLIVLELHALLHSRFQHLCIVSQINILHTIPNVKYQDQSNVTSFIASINQIQTQDGYTDDQPSHQYNLHPMHHQ